MSEFFNTTNLKGHQLKLAEDQAGSQDFLTLKIFTDNLGEIYTASDIFKIYEGSVHRAPITSWRRSLSNLKRSNTLNKTLHKKAGIYGRPEYFYELKTQINEH